MNQSFSITMPCGQMRIYMGIHQLMSTIAHQVVEGDMVHSVGLPAPTQFSLMPHDHPPVEELYQRKIYKLREVFDVQRAVLSEKRITTERIVENTFKFMTERFKEFVSKKNPEFYIPDLDLHSVENLGVKYMENFGSDSGSLCIFKLSDYHKFAAMIDHEAFRFFRNEDGTHGELVEMRPDRWVLGRYDNDLKILKEMADMRRYDSSFYHPAGNDDARD